MGALPLPRTLLGSGSPLLPESHGPFKTGACSGSGVSMALAGHFFPGSGSRLPDTLSVKRPRKGARLGLKSPLLRLGASALGRLHEGRASGRPRAPFHPQGLRPGLAHGMCSRKYYRINESLYSFSTLIRK